MSALPASSPAETDALDDPHRVASARRLLLEVPGPAAFDRLSALAARLVGADHAKVTLFPDHDVVVGGYGLPDGAVGGPALLTGALSALIVRRGAPLNLPEAARDERVAGLPAVTSGEVAAYLGAPLIAASGHVVGVLAVYDPVPRAWSADAGELLEQLATSVVAELELSAAQSAVGASLARLEVALEASSVGIWERDLRTGTVHWDERCAAIFGIDGAVELASMERLLGHVHPDDHAAVQEAMRVALVERGEYAVEARVLRVGGDVRWTVSSGRVVTDSRGEPVRVLGTTVDVTDARDQAARRLSSLQRTTAIAEVAAALASATRIDQLAHITLRGAEVLGASTGALAVFDPGSGALHVHMGRRLADIVEVRATEAGVEVPADGVEIQLDDELPTQWVARHGEPVLLADPEEAAARFPRMAEMTRLLDAHALAALPLRVEGRLLGSFVAVWGTEHPFDDDDVEVLEALTAQIALSVSRLQADAERDAAVAAMAAANARLQLLAETGRVLSGTPDITEQISQLTELVVPALGDWCWVLVNDERGRMRDMATGHRDPSRAAELERYVRVMVAEMTEHAAARVVLRTGRPLVLPSMDADFIARALPDQAARDALEGLGASAGLAVPLISRGQTLGVLGLYTGSDRGPHTQAEIDTALEVGRRAGLALHQARLFGQQRQLAETLQRSMLTAPPAPDHCEIAVRYVPAAAGAEVGGDWYDAFVQPDGGTVLVIGDVVGHDSRAAASMGQLRGLLRGIGYHTGGTPAEVLTGLDQAARGLDLDAMATAVVARLEQDDPELQEGTTRVRWSSAGHPPPVLLSPDGSVTLLDEDRPDLLLGVEPATPRVDRVATIARGGTLLLYTDGLVERRDRDLDAGTDELRRVVGELGYLPLQQMCDRLLERMYLPDTEDDVALLAVRLHPQDAPRPPEAGPQRVPPGIGPSPAVHDEAPEFHSAG
ncbi:PAS domain S-box-containing protein [Modestobacter sp. DSM 44400]|uniref:SpoIIE family protein phosphatase n=1 Tax=Modestobacter sp. DSM 44400 TaxID=1550230 RepID=UPI00089A4918|nr:SpoIIE family protein phosphatase [Modestobacter sp. DSM 44400]SDY39841.1 PAS domain S-box-containing protein [Modestobacter sp. DSM 44400]